jgi:ubiquinone/menaquinone biosynthesis methyltransferase
MNIYNSDYVKQLFNHMSSSYERMNYITSFGLSQRWRNQALKTMNLSQEPVKVIDLMTGMGEMWSSVSRALPSCEITAIDFSDGMLVHAKHRNNNKYNGTVSIVNEDVLNNSLPSNYFDYVICAYGLKTFDADQVQRLAKEVVRILKTGGQFSFVEVSKPGNQLLSVLYGFYLGKVIPLLGWTFLGHPDNYRMLWRYVSKFERINPLTKQFENAGLTVKIHSYFYGCATGLSGYKPA